MRNVGIAALTVLLAVAFAPGAGEAGGLDKVIDHPRLATGLEQALVQCERWTGLAIYVDWEGIEKTGASRKTPVKVDLKQATGGQLLELVLIRASQPGKPLGWFEAEGGIFVTTQRLALTYQRRRINGAIRVQAPPPPRRARTETPAAATPAATPARATVGRDSNATLRPKVSAIRAMNFVKTPASDVFAWLRDVTGLNLHVRWNALEAVGIAQDTPVTIEVRDVSVSKALDLVMDDLSGTRDRYERVYWVVEDNVVTVSTGEALNQTVKTVVIDVADLLAVAPDYEGPKVTTDQTSTSDQDSGSGIGTSIFAPEEDKDKEDGPPTRQELRDKLSQLIKDSIGEEMWLPEGKGAIHFYQNRLVISQTALGFKLLQGSSLLR